MASHTPGIFLRYFQILIKMLVPTFSLLGVGSVPGVGGSPCSDVIHMHPMQHACITSHRVHKFQSR